MSKCNRKCLWIWHSGFRNDSVVDPNPNITKDYIGKVLKDSPYVIIRHSLFTGGKTTVTWHNPNGTTVVSEHSWLGKLPGPVRYITETFFNLLFIVRYNIRDTICAVDPLSALAPSLLKRLGFVKNVYFFTPDFALKRFENVFIDKAYFSIDKFCTFNCTLNICNSAYVIEHKKKIYGATISSQLFHLPNVPPAWIVEKYRNMTKKAHQLVYVSSLSDDSLPHFKTLFDAIKGVSVNIPDVKLVIVGDGTKKSDIEAMADGHVVFTGLLSHQDTLQQIAESEVGIALYDGSNSYDQFRDSLKIREYQALGTIPLTTSVVKANTDDVVKYGGGIVLEKFTGKDVENALYKVFVDPAYAQQLKENAFLTHAKYENRYDEFIKKVDLSL